MHDGIDLDVMRGEVFGVIGGSGSGKSVLLRTIIGLNEPAAGTVEVFGQDVWHLPQEALQALEKRWGVLFQDGALFSSLTVAENIELALRAALARALGLDPELLFLDEPTSGLDPIAADAFDKLIKDLQTSLGLTVFLVTHDLETVFTICDRVAVLVDKNVHIGTPDELWRDDHPWIRDYLRSPQVRAAREAARQQHELWRRPSN